MAKKLRDNLTNAYFEAANKLMPKNSKRRIVAYVESYDDIYFWRTVLGRFENDKLYFEVMLPSKINLLRGKKSVLKELLDSPDKLGDSLIACVDADYDYLLQGVTHTSETVIKNPFVFHTYVYAIENFQCYAQSLHDVCVAVTLNDHHIFDFETFFREFSEACFPLFVWSVWAYRTGHHTRFSMSDFNRVTDPGGFTVLHPENSIANIKKKVYQKVRELQRQFPGNKEAYLKLKDELVTLGVTPQTTYLFVQGHHLFDTVTAPILTKVCNILRQERQNEIYNAQAHHTQKRNEMSCYENSLQDVKAMLKKNTGYMMSPQFAMIQEDIKAFLSRFSSQTD